MAKNDLPDPRALRIIAAATTDEQAEVWKQHRPRRGQGASWGEISHALSKTRMRATDAKFGADAAQAFGIVWDEDLFAPADEDSRSTTQVEAFLAAQHAWLEANLLARGTIVTMDDYGRPKLPKGAQPHYGRPGAGVLTAFAIETRSGTIREQAYTLPPGRLGAVAGDQAADTVRKPRPDLTAKGAAMVGDLRTDALHQALREKPIGDDQLIGLLVLALGGRNVTVLSGVAGRTRGNTLGRIADSLTEGGVLTRDLGRLRHAAREALVEVLSCRDNPSASGLGARFAGTAIDADAFLPNMATEAFLSAVSHPALEQCAAAHAIAPGSRVKDTRAAMVSHFRDATFVYPGARFAPTEAELQARRNAARVFQEGADDDDEIGDGEDDAAGDGVDDDQDEDGAPNHGAPDKAALVSAMT